MHRAIRLSIAGTLLLTLFGTPSSGSVGGRPKCFAAEAFRSSADRTGARCAEQRKQQGPCYR